MLELGRISGSRLASWQIEYRTAHHHAAIRDWGAAVRRIPTTPTVRTMLARRGEPGGSHSSSPTPLNTEHSRVIASEIAPDIHTLFRIVVLFTWICTCHSCKLSLLACNDAPGTIRGLRGPTTPELLTAFSHLKTNRLPQDEPNRSYDFPHTIRCRSSSPRPPNRRSKVPMNPRLVSRGHLQLLLDQPLFR